MSKGSFKIALDRVLQHEGGKVDDPQDPGGRTNQGVTQAVYSAYRKKIGSSPRDVFDMHPDERDEIYREQYWNAIKGDDLPVGLDYVVFDGAVNSGVSRSSKWLQQALGVEMDGIVGVITLAAAKTCDVDRTIDEICDIRMTFLKGLKHWPRFGRGWTTRVSGVRKVGKAWTGKSPMPPITSTPMLPMPKATKPVDPVPATPGFLTSILMAIFGRRAA